MKTEDLYVVFTIKDGYIEYRTNSGQSGSSPLCGNTAKEEINELIEMFGIRPHQWEII
jgi:hypothetical protein